MRRTHVHDPIIDQLITGDHEIIHNIMYRIRESEDASVWTDDRICVMAQSNPGTHMWVCLTDVPGPALQSEMAAIIAAALQAGPSVGVTINETLGAGVLAEVETLLQRRLRVVMPMVAYSCGSACPVPTRGKMVTPSAEDVQAMALLVQQMSLDCEGIAVSDEDAAGFAQAHVGSDILYLWKDAGEAVVMARIPHRNDRYARVATVVTRRDLRNRGYGGMLMSSLCALLLSQGVTPMLYADARNPASNRMYQNVGFTEAGRVTNLMLASLEETP